MATTVCEITRHNSQTYALRVEGDRLIWSGGADVDVGVTTIESLRALLDDLDRLEEDGYESGLCLLSIADLREAIIEAAPHTAGWDWAAGSATRDEAEDEDEAEVQS